MPRVASPHGHLKRALVIVDPIQRLDGNRPVEQDDEERLDVRYVIEIHHAEKTVEIPGDHRKPVVLHEESVSSRYDTQAQPLVRDPPGHRPSMREPPDARQMHSAKTPDAEHAEKRAVSANPRIGSSP